MNENGFEVINQVKDFFTFYFIESHLKNINDDIEIVVESSQKFLRPIRKVLQKEIREKLDDYIVSVYAIDFKPALIKKKELKDINNSLSFQLKICLKMKKNKFESHNYINSSSDSFNPNINFEIMKKIFGKDIPPPPQLQLTILQIIQLFSDALLIRERKNIIDPCYEYFLKFSVNLLKENPKYELSLFYKLYVDILNGNNLTLIKDIFGLFNLEKLIRPINSNTLSVYQEKLELLYHQQNQIFEKIKRIPIINFNSYLIKFYTIYVYLFAIIENYETCERIMVDLRDNNTYDNLILAKLYLSEYSNFYRGIPISEDLQNSLMGKFIYTSENYNNLLTSFLLISDYIKKDFANTLLIITENYEKIHDICHRSNSSVKINDYITQKPNDDLSKIKEYLDFIRNKKLEKKFKSIHFNLNMWDLYLANNNNPSFLEYLKSKLIIGSLSYNEIVEVLSYIIKYTNKDFVEMLKILTINYDKIKDICIAEKKQIIIKDFIIQNINDNQEGIKEYLSFIVSRKLKDQYETIFFNVDIWKFYIINNCQFDFLCFLENKLYESSINYKEILDCLDYSSTLRKKNFISMLEIILYNFDKIQYIFKNEIKNIYIEAYIIQQNDDLSKIYELIKSIIEKEKESSYCSVKFNVNLWLPYSQCEVLDTLKFIRKIINECKKLEPELNEDGIDLTSKIHNVGFIEIKRGILTGEKLLQFLGEDEAFYVNKQINDCIQKNINLQNQVNSQQVEIEQLKGINNTLLNRVGVLEGQIVNLTNANAAMNQRIQFLDNAKANLIIKIDEMKDKMKYDIECLRKKIKEYHP